MVDALRGQTAGSLSALVITVALGLGAPGRADVQEVTRLARALADKDRPGQVAAIICGIGAPVVEAEDFNSRFGAGPHLMCVVNAAKHATGYLQKECNDISGARCWSGPWTTWSTRRDKPVATP